MNAYAALSKDRLSEVFLKAILKSYPKVSAKYLMIERNPFLNPVGGVLREATGVLLDWVCNADPKKPNWEPIERLMRLLALDQGISSAFFGHFLALQRVLKLYPDWTNGMCERFYEAYLKLIELDGKAKKALFALRLKEAKAHTRTFSPGLRIKALP